MTKLQENDAPFPIYARVMLAGASNMTGATVTNPLDVIKTRLQLTGEGSMVKSQHVHESSNVIIRSVHLLQSEGLAGLYKGLVPSLMREGSYSAIRLGIYEPVKELLGAQDRHHTPLYLKIVAGAITGSIGSAIATPTDLVKVRLQADPTGKRYASTLACFRHIFQQEGGLRGLYQGVGPTVKRAAILTAAQIPAYDHTKHTLLNYGLLQEGFGLHVCASMVAGFIAALVSSPADVVKTRMMNQATKTAPGGIRPYTGAIDCVIKTVKAEGLRGLFKGFFPSWLRIGPHTIVTFMVFEQMRSGLGYAPM